MPEDLKFKHCDTASAFAEVRRKTETEARSLWNRLLPEIGRNSIDGEMSYMEVEFDQLGEQLEQELARLAIPASKPHRLRRRKLKYAQHRGSGDPGWRRKLESLRSAWQVHA